MELILAIVVASAVIFFGALISMGNERQRKAIDGLREQIVLWAMQDLKIKSEHLIQTVQVPDPLSWLNKVASKVCGYDLKLQVLEMFEEPQSLICTSGDGSVRVVFSPLSPADIRRIKVANKTVCHNSIVWWRYHNVFCLHNRSKPLRIRDIRRFCKNGKNNNSLVSFIMNHLNPTTRLILAL